MARKKVAEQSALTLDDSGPAAEWVEVSKLKPWIKNPRAHSDADVESIIKSIRAFGWGEPLLARKEDGELIAGHGRVLAAERLGIKRVPVRYMDLSERLAHGLALADNKVAEKSRWDKELLPVALEEQRVDVRVFEATGFSFEEHYPEDKPVVDEDAVPEAPKVPITKLGDVWQCGDHLVVCGDSFRPETRAMAALQRVDLVVTDPPYGIFGSSTGIGTDITDEKMVRPFYEQTFAIIAEHLKDFGHAYTCCDWRSYAIVWDASKRMRCIPKNLIVWDKGDQGMGSMYQQCYELVAFFAKTPPPKGMKSTSKKGHRVIKGKPNVFRAHRVSGEERQHNAAKPVAMFRYFMENSSDEGQLVVDFFAGSGTMLIAAEQTKRRSVSFDIEPSECDKMILRWQKLTGRTAVRSGGHI
jgi:DNA modification methylase